ncbi:uncharacterized protein LOC122538440 [Frieseomelitta varia]|uniref:uncharacterized protein LOC122538440 n=1 Tax=Frieseomelitta varia TaxID=561572 RepID=UPI001CB67A4A|nr:uncharacterized protein LOC122538440 [Frieseomelitta varia]
MLQKHIKIRSLVPNLKYTYYAIASRAATSPPKMQCFLVSEVLYTRVDVDYGLSSSISCSIDESIYECRDEVSWIVGFERRGFSQMSHSSFVVQSPGYGNA